MRRARITLDLGRELFHAGERGEAWNHFHAATALARDLDDPDLLARVALTVYRCGLEGDDQTQLRHELLRTAHRKLVGAASGAGEASIAAPTSACCLARCTVDPVAWAIQVASTGAARRPYSASKPSSSRRNSDRPTRLTRHTSRRANRRVASLT